MRLRSQLPIGSLLTLFLLPLLWGGASFAEGVPQKLVEKPVEKPSEKGSTPAEAQNPAQIELLETRVHFETDGSSRKEVHARVHINSELGVRQFARLNFDYNRSFGSVELPLVRITHASGGIADILPSSITDNPNPAVVNAPAYQDVRVKSVRILGLQPGDNLEYRIITTISHHPLAPDFWLEHSFDRTGVVTQEFFELDLPASRFEARIPKSYPPSQGDPLGLAPPGEKLFGLIALGTRRSSKPGRIYVSPRTPETSKESLDQGDSKRLIYRWSLNRQELQKSGENLRSVEGEESDVVLSTFGSWSDLAIAMGGTRNTVSTSDLDKLHRLIGTFPPDSNPEISIYEFVSKRIRTIDLPFDTCLGLPQDVFATVSNGYGTSEAKALLSEALTAIFRFKTRRSFFSPGASPESQLPRPTAFTRVLLEIDNSSHLTFLDPSLEVAPFGLISADMRGGKALQLSKCTLDESQCWVTIPKETPFPAKQGVNVDATLGADGKLTAKVHYSLRGDNELLLRVAFHKSPKEKWAELGQLLSLSDGFRGKVTSVTTSDPYATKEPFKIEYELTQPKFVDWSKKPVRIPALLPQLGLPDAPAKPAAGAAASPIELGTPLEVETRATLHLPPGTTAETPTGTAVQRDYATYASQYSAKGPAITASRHIQFLLRQVPADRAADYNAFLHAVQNDEAQDFTLERPTAPQSKSSTSNDSPQTKDPKP